MKNIKDYTFDQLKDRFLIMFGIVIFICLASKKVLIISAIVVTIIVILIAVVVCIASGWTSREEEKIMNQKDKENETINNTDPVSSD